MIRLRTAKPKEAERILKFYQNTIDSIKETEFKPKWNEYYPDLEYLQTGIEKQELYVCTKNNNIIASVVLNNGFNPEYENVNWIADAKPNETVVIHTFAIASNFMGNGIGKEIFNQIKTKSLENNKKTIRIDIIDGNLGAQKVFEKFGFEYIGSTEIFHEAVGLEKFHLYEHVLKN